MKFAGRILILLLLLPMFFFCIGCGDDDDDDSSSQNVEPDNVRFPVENPPAISSVDGPEALCNSGAELNFDLYPGAKNIPFPSDFFTVEDAASPTGIRVHLEDQVSPYIDGVLNFGLFAIREGLNSLNGFGLATPVYFPLNAVPDPNLIPDNEDPGSGDAIFCVVLDDRSSSHTGEYLQVDIEYVEKYQYLRIMPYLPFPQDSTIGCVVTDTLRTDDDRCYGASEHFRYLKAAKRDADNPHAELLDPYRQEFLPLFESLLELTGVKRQDVLAATFYSTQWITHDLLSVREQLETMAEQKPPVVSDWEKSSTSQANLDSIWHTTYETISWRDRDGHFVYDENGDPKQDGTSTVTMRLNLPLDGIGGYSQPYPVVIFGHGAVSSKNSSTSMGNFLAEYGFATVGIDWVWHGDRMGKFQNLDDTLRVVLTSLEFYNVFDPIAFRDNFRQDVSDIMYLKHVIKTLGSLDLLPAETGGDGIPDLDVDHLYYMGMSLGSMHGGVLGPFEPDFDAYYYNVGGSDFRTIATTCPIGEILMEIIGGIEFIFDLDIMPWLDQLLDLEAHTLEGGDSYTHGLYLLQEPLFDNEPGHPSVFLQMTAYDETLGGPSGSMMARSQGLTLLNPFVFTIPDAPVEDTPFQGPGVYQFNTSNHNMIFGGEFRENARYQGGTFLRTAFDDGIGTIVDPFGVK